MVELGSAYEGRRCNVIRYMLGHGPVDEDEIVRRLGMAASTAPSSFEASASSKAETASRASFRFEK